MNGHKKAYKAGKKDFYFVKISQNDFYMTVIGKRKDKERREKETRARRDKRDRRRGKGRRERERGEGREMQLLKFASNAVNRMPLPENAPVRAKRRRPMLRGERGKEEAAAGMRVYRETTCCGAVGGGGVH